MAKSYQQPGPDALSRRERQIMHALWKLGRGTVHQVRALLPAPPGYDAVRTTLRILRAKGYVRTRREGTRDVYAPRVPPGRARSRAVQALVATFFGGSVNRAALALLRESDLRLRADEVARLSRLVDEEEER